MRIIAGEFKGKRLYSPRTTKTRPTLDRVKEAVFSILIPYIQDANVLDLFSGTGSLGIEAISRGAKYSILNDLDISTILDNVKLTNSSNYVKISRKDYIKCLGQVIKENVTFDIIFLDPPYESNYAYNSLKIISDNKDKILSKCGVIVYESDKNSMKDKNQDYQFENLECFDERTYGRVMLRLYRWR